MNANMGESKLKQCKESDARSLLGGDGELDKLQIL
jgi:hypothetical protein